MGEFLPFTQWSRAELEKAIEIDPFESKWYFIQKKDGTKIGYIFNFNMLHITRALVDYLFASMGVPRVQAIASINNKASQRVAEKAGFTREGTIRRTVGGERDLYLYSILREEWKEPKILTRTEKK
jgi:hypothetical protein